MVSVLEQKERDALAAPDVATRRWLLTEATRYAEEVVGGDAVTDKASEITKRLRTKLDELNGVVQLPALQMLADFSSSDRNSQPARVLSVGDDLYVLDRGAGTVWMLTLSKDLGTTGAPKALWKRGDALDGVTLGDAMASFWMYGGAPGLPEQVYALDGAGVLVRLGKDKPSQAMRLPAAAALPLVKGAVGQAGNLYVLDPQRRVVWRYLPGAGGYDRPPQEYLNEETAPGLSGAVDLAGDGNLFVLFSDGQITRFSGGKAQTFPAVVPDSPLRKPVSITVSPATKYVYVADAGNARVVKFTKDGQYVCQYKAPKQGFDDLRGAFVDEQKGRLYTIVGTRAFVSELPPETRP
ncbi:MAG: NHL repeat-containing protein [Chloroflexota bacterium]